MKDERPHPFEGGYEEGRPGIGIKFDWGTGVREGISKKGGNRSG